ncbi:restriction endonuclease [Mycobacterium sp. WMMD1722]|uniref:restriction endonuclease n=1 Tax=Mycobacterium sp. WMMD1722 TaxID=3404117 RepID=UPI003BF55DEC
MPWSSLRIKLLLVVGVAAALTAYLTGASAPTCIAAAVAAPLLTAATPRFVRGVIAGATTPRAPTADMSGTEFEDYIAGIARSCGVPVIMTPLTGDWGVDIIVGTRPNRLAVQCKRQARPVGAGAVQEVVAGAPMQDCAKTMVVTDNDFTPAARRLAEHHGCELIGRDELPRLRSTIRRLTVSASP